MGLVLLLALACLCFALPLFFYRKGKVQKMTVYFWYFFGATAFINGVTLRFLFPDGEINPWTGMIGPAIVQVPFAFMIYLLERPNRGPVTALIMAILGSFMVTGLWLMTSVFFLHLK